MDLYEAGKSSTSASTVLSGHDNAVKSCSFTFQGFRSPADLLLAVDEHALKTVGHRTYLSDHLGLLYASDAARHLPAGLVRPEFAALCAGDMQKCFASLADRRLFAEMFCDDDLEAASLMIVANTTSHADFLRRRHPVLDLSSSPTAPAPLREGHMLSGTETAAPDDASAPGPPRGGLLRPVDAPHPPRGGLLPSDDAPDSSRRGSLRSDEAPASSRGGWLRSSFAPEAEDPASGASSPSPGSPRRRGPPILRATFGDDTRGFAMGVRTLRLLLGRGDVVALPLSTEVYDLIKSMVPEQLLTLAAFVQLELPPGKWNAVIRGSQVLPPLVSKIGAICEAYREWDAEVVSDSSSPALGAGRGGGGSRLSLSPSRESGSGLAPPPPPRLETGRDIGYRHGLSKAINLLLARFRSLFKSSLATLARMGTLSRAPMDISNFPVEALIGIHDSLIAQHLGVSILEKSMTVSGAGTSLATQKAMAALRDPDALFKDMILDGQVSFDDISPYEQITWVLPYGAWIARATFAFHIGELPRSVVTLMAYARSFSCLNASGALSLHAPYMELSTLLNQCEAQRATINVRDVVLAITEQLEKVPEGISGPFDVFVGQALRIRQPVRQSDSAPASTLTGLMGLFGELAKAEAFRDSMRTPGLLTSRPEGRRAFALHEHRALDLDTDVFDHDAGAYEGTVHALAAITRASPLPCPGCGAEGMSGTPWNPCCSRFGSPQIICNRCHTVTPAISFRKTGCNQRVKLPPCGDDDDTGIVPGDGHDTPTASEAAAFTRHYLRIKAMRARQAASALARSTGAAMVSQAAAYDMDEAYPNERRVGAVTSSAVALGVRFADVSGSPARVLAPPSPLARLALPAPFVPNSSKPAPERVGERDTRKRATKGPQRSTDPGQSPPALGVGLAASGTPGGNTAKDPPLSSQEFTIAWKVVPGQLLPLLSLAALEAAVRAAGGDLQFCTSSTPPSASLTLKSANGAVFKLMGRREQGYIVVRLREAGHNRFVLDPFGPVALILDSGAQVCIMGSEHAHLLTARAPPPSSLRVFGAGETRLHVREVGTMSIAFASSPALPGMLPRQMVQHVRVDQLRVGMIRSSDVTPPVVATAAIPVAVVAPRQPDRRPRHVHGPAGPARRTPPRGHSPRLQQVEVRLAASRLGIFDLPTFLAFQRLSEGLIESGDPLSYFGALDADGFYRDSVRRAASTMPLPEARVGVVGALPGQVSSLTVVGPLSRPLGGPIYVALLVDSATGFVWSHQLRDLGQAAVESLLRVHFCVVADHRAHGGSSVLLRDVYISSPVEFPLPYSSSVTVLGVDQTVATYTVHIHSAPQDGQLLSPADCVARQAVFRGVGYLLRGGLSLRALACLLPAACYAVNVQPRMYGSDASASRFARWMDRNPYLGGLAATPGSVIRYVCAQSSSHYGLYLRPLDDGCHEVLCLETGLVSPTSGLRGAASAFVVDLLRTSSRTAGTFDTSDLDALIRGELGEMVTVGGAIGLCPDAWGRALARVHGPSRRLAPTYAYFGVVDVLDTASVPDLPESRASFKSSPGVTLCAEAAIDLPELAVSHSSDEDEGNPTGLWPRGGSRVFDSGAQSCVLGDAHPFVDDHLFAAD